MMYAPATYEYVCPVCEVCENAPTAPVCWIRGCGTVMERGWRVEYINTKSELVPHPANARWSHATHVRFGGPDVT